MYYRRQFIHKQDTQLGLDLFLQVITDERDGVERRGDFERFERIIPKDNGDSLLLGEHKNDESGQVEVGQRDLEWDGQANTFFWPPSSRVSETRSHNTGPGYTVKESRTTTTYSAARGSGEANEGRVTR